MTDEAPQLNPNIDPALQKNKTDLDKNLVRVGADGDPLPDGLGTKMLEIESLERVQDGLRIATEAFAHFAKIDARNYKFWAQFINMLDRVRADALTVSKSNKIFIPTKLLEPNDKPMEWRQAHMRMRNGLKQAYGGMRQLAVCFRSDLQWSRMANDIDNLEAKLSKMTARKPLSAIFGAN